MVTLDSRERCSEARHELACQMSSFIVMHVRHTFSAESACMYAISSIYLGALSSMLHKHAAGLCDDVIQLPSTAHASDGLHQVPVCNNNTMMK